MTQKDEDLATLRSTFNKFEEAFEKWLKDEFKVSYEAVQRLFQQIINDYEYIQEEYEGGKKAKIAENIAYAYFCSMTKKLPINVFEGFLYLFLESNGGSKAFGELWVTALSNLPGEKHEEKERVFEGLRRALEKRGT